MEVYDELLVPRLFEPWARLLADLLEVNPGEAVLDVGCGPGSVARIVSERVGPSGRVTACDLSPAMLAVAESKQRVEGGAEITYAEAPADRLPAQDGACDAVTCQQALQFFPDRPAAVGEMYRVLRPGGRVGLAVWTEIEHSPALCALANAVEKVAGTEVADRYRGGPWGLADEEVLKSLLGQAGFEQIRISRHTLPVTFEQGPVQLIATLAASGIAEQVDQLPGEQKELLAQTLADDLGSGPIRSEMESNVALARR